MKVSVNGATVEHFLVRAELYCNSKFELCRGPLAMAEVSSALAKITTDSGKVAYGSHHSSPLDGLLYITINELLYLDAIKELLGKGQLHRLTLIHRTEGPTGKMLEINDDLYEDHVRYSAPRHNDILEADYIRINNASV